MYMTYLAVLAMSLALSTPSQAQTQDPRAEAERLARSGEHAEALKRFQAIVAANPADVAARLWIGRLHMEMGEPRRASAVFESIVATEPQNVDALLGLGRAHTATGRLKDAADALNRAEAMAAERADVLSAQGELHAAEGRSTLALAYFARAAVLEPTNVEIRRAAEKVRAARAHSVELGYDFQHFNIPRDDTHTGSVMLNLRLHDSFRIFAGGQTHRAFEEYENRGGGGIEWRPVKRVWLRGGAMIGSDTVDLPEIDVFGSVVHRGPRAHLGVDLRYLDYEGATLWIGGPTLDIDVTDRSTLALAYYWGSTTFDGVSTSTTSNTVKVGWHTRIGERASGTVEYWHGLDRLDWLTSDRLFASDANTLSLGLGYDMTPFVNVNGRYDFQSRPNDENVQRASARLIFRF